MSLRYGSRIVYQASMKAAQGIKDQVSAAIKSLRDTTASSKQVRKLSSGFDRESLKHKGAKEEIKKAEESLRTVMYLSCWGPN